MMQTGSLVAPEALRPLALVTGGASGIGLAVALQLTGEGWDVVVGDANAEAVERLTAQSRATPIAQGLGVCEAVCLDVTDADAVADLFTRIDGARLRGLVNAAGIGRSVPFLDTSVELFRKILDVNLVGTFIVGKAAATCMSRAYGGSIVNISSGSALRGNAGRAAYGASKGGVEMLTKVMAVELSAAGIRVNSVAPGPIETPLVATMHSAADRARAVRSVPQGRYGTPEDIAMAVSFLLEDRRSGYMTGATLCVDGGFAAAGSFDAVAAG